MKTSIKTLVALSIIFIALIENKDCFSQVDPKPYRGLYVNKFLKNSSAGTVIDAANTILGIQAKEMNFFNLQRTIILSF